MQWADVVRVPTRSHLRQFAGLWIVFFGGLALSRAWSGRFDGTAQATAAIAITFGVIGLWRPLVMRWVFTGWMVVAFPIGWTVSRIMLALLYYVVFTPMGLALRLIGRDALGLRRPRGESCWVERPAVVEAKTYLRQS
jgi:hypothetical protein